jgi:hypothetical protein
MFFNDVFPTLTQWAQKNLSGRDRTIFDEYHHVVQYHLSQADEASRDSSSSLWQFQWAGNPSKDEVFVLGFSANSLAKNGDFAIREAASAIDTGLLMVNHILKLGIDQTRIWWGLSAKEGPLKTAVRNMDKNRGSGLIGALDSVFGSIGYELLIGYRNWVTHRGAPSVIVPDELNRPIPIPKEAIKSSEPKTRNWFIETYLLATIPSKILVTCWPFVPPVSAVLNAQIDEAESDIVLPGIKIGKGARNISIKDMRIVAGDLTMNAEQFKKQNSILLEKNQARVAGEDLAVYTGIDYVQAVGSVVRFARTVLTGAWDSELAKLCA